MTILKREELHKDIWTRPAVKVAAELGISSSALRRICLSMNIPTPPLGYWAKVAAGKKVRKKKLPKANDETRLEWVVDLENSRRQPGMRHRPTQEERESFPEVVIADNMENLHSLVKNTRTHLRETWSKRDWSKRKQRKRLDANVSPDSLDRSLLFLDAMVRGLEAQGLTLASSMDCPKARRELGKPHYERVGNPCECCWVVVGDEHVCFSLREKNTRTHLEDADRLFSWQEWKDTPSGKLQFTVEAGYGFSRRKTWRDGKVQRIEQFLGEIVATFPLAGEYLRKQTIERRIKEERWALIEAARQRFERQRWQEERTTEKLLEDVDKHRKAESIRSFLEACRGEVVRRHGQQEPGSDLDLWLKWVGARADTIDPMCGEDLPWMHEGLPLAVGACGLEDDTSSPAREKLVVS